MKKLLGLVLGLALLTIVSRPAFASEGQSVMQPTTGLNPKCLVNSVFIDSTYDVMLTCRGLITPYSAEVTRYIFWYYSAAQKGWLSFGKLNQGKLLSSTNIKFDQVMITAEETNSPRKPSDIVIATGQMVPYDFDKTTTPLVTVTPTPTVLRSSGTTTVTPIGGTSTNVIGNFVKAVARLLIIGFVVLLVGVVVMTIITRRRES